MAGDLNLSLFKGPLFYTPSKKSKLEICCGELKSKNKKNEIVKTWNFYAYNKSDQAVSVMFHGIRSHNLFHNDNFNRLNGEYKFEYLEPGKVSKAYSVEEVILRTLLGKPRFSNGDMSTPFNIDVAFIEPDGKLYKEKFKIGM